MGNHRDKKNQQWIVRPIVNDQPVSNGVELMQRDPAGGWAQLETKCLASETGLRFTGSCAPVDPKALANTLADEVAVLTKAGFIVQTPIRAIKYSDLVKKWNSQGLFSTTVHEEDTLLPAPSPDTLPKEAQIEYSQQTQDAIRAIEELNKEFIELNETKATEVVSDDDDRPLLGFDDNGEPVFGKTKPTAPKEVDVIGTADKQLNKIQKDEANVQLENKYLREKNLSLQTQISTGSVDQTHDIVSSVNSHNSNEFMRFESSMESCLTRLFEQYSERFEEKISSVEETMTEMRVDLHKVDEAVQPMKKDVTTLMQMSRNHQTKLSALTAITIDVVKRPLPSPVCASTPPAKKTKPVAAAIAPVCLYCGESHSWKMCAKRAKNHICGRCTDPSHPPFKCPHINATCTTCFSKGHLAKSHLITDVDHRNLIIDLLGLHNFKHFLKN